MRYCTHKMKTICYDPVQGLFVIIRVSKPMPIYASLIQFLIGVYSILDSNDIRGTRAQMQIVGIEPDNISIISASPASGQPEALEVERDTHVLW